MYMHVKIRKFYSANVGVQRTNILAICTCIHVRCMTVLRHVRDQWMEGG